MYTDARLVAFQQQRPTRAVENVTAVSPAAGAAWDNPRSQTELCMTSYPSLSRLMLAGVFSVGLLTQAYSQVETASCVLSSAACVDSCGRFDQGDVRSIACENICRQSQLGGAGQCTDLKTPGSPAPRGAVPEVRGYSKKGDTIRERELNGKMVEAIAQRNLREIRRLIEMKKGLNPTYTYNYDYNPETRVYEGKAVKLRLTDVFNDAVTVRGDEAGLDKVLALLIELGLDVTATLPATSELSGANSAPRERTAWGPSPVFIERARDRNARMRMFDIALENGLKPNDDVRHWLFAELPQVCGRDRSQFAIQLVDLLVKHLGTSLQDDFWRIGERGPETVSDVLDRLMSPGKAPRSNSERAQFAMMDEVWENCAPLSRRINRYLIEGN